MTIDKKFDHDADGQEPRIILTPWVKGEPLAYKCSRCGQTFLLPEDRTPKEGVEELWAAFRQHVFEEYHDGAARIKGSGLERES